MSTRWMGNCDGAAIETPDEGARPPAVDALSSGHPASPPRPAAPDLAEGAFTPFRQRGQVMSDTLKPGPLRNPDGSLPPQPTPHTDAARTAGAPARAAA